MNDRTAYAFGLFGREDDLRIIGAVLESGGSALALGDPGVGKSSLLKVAGQLAQRHGRRVLSVSPTPFEQGLPFAGLAELISQVPDGMDRELPEPQRRALAVALQRAEPDGPEADPLAVPLAVRGLLHQLCAREPVAVVIDDLQWMDHPSQGSLGFAMRRLPVEPERLSVLVGARPEGGARDLMRSLPEPRHDLALAPLDEWAIGQLLRKRFGPRWTPLLSAGGRAGQRGEPVLGLDDRRGNAGWRPNLGCGPFPAASRCCRCRRASPTCYASAPSSWGTKARAVFACSWPPLGASP